MKYYIYCRTTDKGVQSFYLTDGRKNYFLFYQKYRKSVREYFVRGVTLNDAMNVAKAHGSTAVIRTMRKIPMYIKYLEKENGLEVLDKTKERNKINKFRNMKKERFSATDIVMGNFSVLDSTTECSSALARKVA